MSITQFGNKLYTGEKSYPFVGKRKTWFTIAAVIMLICIVGTLVRGGFQLGIEFTGGSEFRVSGIQTDGGPVDIEPAEAILEQHVDENDYIVSNLGQDGLRIESSSVDDDQTNAIKDQIASEYGVESGDVTSSHIGPSWGQDVSNQGLRALLIFIALAALVMALYFRTWKMSVAALVALGFDMVVTAGVYGIVGFEVTPAALIGFLTIMAYSLYDTVVVFDKIRENTAPGSSGSYDENINLAVNQTLMRSINTSVVALLPVASILFIGAFVLGAGTLRDIALALLIGMFVGTWSTIFIAAPFYAQLRKGESIATESKRKQERGAVV
ncbi:protein translocase subunit SecF [Agrococcus casei]|uniref:Protein-export membrane protein SecF n=1 Tax=Agrococcus casei LMG 22410 TaxID=1255656 RepID=A0A1R4FPW9_9MICO|nr:protein translocase subunit SecF [Agrococcus casei]SJM57919.1 Protein-export membrane protein SecF (TC 3.A.5.1.1) [Agrococcus casei LMG 22410]